MESEISKELPFFILSDYEFKTELRKECNILEENSLLLNYVNKLSTGSILNQLNFKYATERQFNAFLVTLITILN
jgi:hypothetical protein